MPAPKSREAVSLRDWLGPEGAARHATEAWLLSQLGEFNPFKWSSVEERQLRRKAFAELALYCQLCHRNGAALHPELYAAVKRWGNTTRFAELIALYPRDVLLYSSVVECLQQRGDLLPIVEKAMRTALATRAPWGQERYPHRQLDFSRFLHVLGDKRARNVQNIARGGNCSTYPELVCPLEDAYALTHNVMYLTDFGAISPLAPIDVPAQVFDGLALRFLAACNFDISLELILTGDYIGRISARVAQLVLHCAGIRLAQSGIVPGPHGSPETFFPSGSRSIPWSQHYHTMLVAAITFMRFDVRRFDQSMGFQLAGSEDLMLAGYAIDLISQNRLAAALDVLGKIVSSNLAQEARGIIQDVIRYVKALRTPNGEIGLIDVPDDAYANSIETLPGVRARLSQHLACIDSYMGGDSPELGSRTLA